MECKARVWTPEPSTSKWKTSVDLVELIKQTKLPIPVQIEFDKEETIGSVTSLFIKDGCLHANMTIDDNSLKLIRGMKPTVGWACIGYSENIASAQRLFAIGMTDKPTILGTWIRFEGVITKSHKELIGEQEVTVVDDFEVNKAEPLYSCSLDALTCLNFGLGCEHCPEYLQSIKERTKQNV